MTPRETADALARELVALGAFRWVAGMAYIDAHGNTGRILIDGSPDQYQLLCPGPARPDLDDPATAACLAVQAMEAGAKIHFDAFAGRWGIRWRPAKHPAVLIQGDTDGMFYGPLGIVSARALIAIKGGG